MVPEEMSVRFMSLLNFILSAPRRTDIATRVSLCRLYLSPLFSHDRALGHSVRMVHCRDSRKNCGACLRRLLELLASIYEVQKHPRSHRPYAAHSPQSSGARLESRGLRQ